MESLAVTRTKKVYADSLNKGELGMSQRELDAKIYPTSFNDLCDCLHLIGTYNSFEPRNVINSLKIINPYVEKYILSREARPAIYILFNPFQISKVLFDLIIESGLAKSAEHTEVSIDNHRWVRLWWE